MKNSFRDNRSGNRPDMFDAICAECGKTCQVPFRPSGDKPVYCSDCFANKRGERDQNNRRDDRRGNRREDRRDRKMYSAICDKCGQACQIPFQPTPGKPVFCDACFGKGGQQGGNKGGDLQSINAKLDKIINALIAAKIIKPEAKPTKVEPKKPEAKKEAKPAKAETRKAPAKKEAPKSPAKKSAKKKK